MKNLMHYFMLSCLKATELVEKKLISRLNPMEAVKLRFHKKMCAACSMYEEQSKIIGHAVHKLDQPIISSDEVEELKGLILSRLK